VCGEKSKPVKQKGWEDDLLRILFLHRSSTEWGKEDRLFEVGKKEKKSNFLTIPDVSRDPKRQSI
jgi:hypothetical protein